MILSNLLKNYKSQTYTKIVTNGFGYNNKHNPSMEGWKKYQKVETSQLIELFQESENKGEVSDNSFLAICFRFRGELLKKCEIICTKRGYDIDVAYEITTSTFKKYGKSKGFKVEKCKSSDVDICFIFYLFKIARNELNDYYRREEKRKNGLLYEGDEIPIYDLPDVDIERLDPQGKLIHETLMSFPRSHRVIYLTYKIYEREGVKLPRKLLKQLRDELGGISQNTVRSYKKEVIDKLEEIRKIFKLAENG